MANAAKQQLKKKLRLQARLKPKLRKFFKQLNMDVQIIWSATGQLPDFEFYEVELISLLRAHYREVAKKFSSTTRDLISDKAIARKLELKQSLAEELGVETTDEEESRIEEAILVGLLAYIASHSIEQAKLILATTNSDYEKIIVKVISEAAASGTTLTRNEASELIGEEFNNKIDGKVETISLTNTQMPAEKTKIIEVGVLSASALVLGGLLVSTLINKIWNSVLIDTTRPHHRAADGQTVRHDQPFIVNGQQLMQPGDTALGASADNIINCLCTTTFELEQ